MDMTGDSINGPRMYPNNGGFFTWLRHPHRGLPYLICSILVILVFLPFLIHYYLSSFTFDDSVQMPPNGRLKAEHADEFGSARLSDIKFQIQELKNIRSSVNDELLELEKKWQLLQAEISNYNSAIENLKQSYQATSQELDKLKMNFKNLQLELQELQHNNMPHIEAPKRILPSLDDIPTSLPVSHPGRCRFSTCFDYSRCSLTSQFPVYVYRPDDFPVFRDMEPFVKYSLMRGFDSSPHVTYDLSIACLYIVLVNDDIITNSSSLKKHLHQLPYWKNDGANHLLVNLARNQTSVDMSEFIHTGRASIAQSTFTEFSFRPGFDIVLPPALGNSHGDVWDQLPMIVPARRKYLLTFFGEHNSDGAQTVLSQKKFTNVHDSRSYSKTSEEQSIFDNSIVETLKSMQTQFASDGFLFQFICDGKDLASGVNGEWSLCGTNEDRMDLLKQSTFSLILAPSNNSIISTIVNQIRIFESLKSGAIPFILGGDCARLPFDDVIDWSKASLVLPKVRMTEMHYYLRSIADVDIIEMRRQGRLIFETHLGTKKSVVDTLLSVVRTRLQIPPYSVREEPSPSVFNDTFVPITETVVDAMLEAEEMLGPVEPPLNFLRYQRNFTSRERSHLFFDPFHLYPFTPFQPIMPGDAKFLGSSYGFRPIGQGSGGSGKEFGEALGENHPREQFTENFEKVDLWSCGMSCPDDLVLMADPEGSLLEMKEHNFWHGMKGLLVTVVILTYEREAVLISAIARLKGLPHLNKVLVVWNNIRPPSEDLRWPEIGVEVLVVRTAKNSLNNRFLPYDAIQTEAVLSLDDDVHLRHDEIMFGFRVWREARDRIVGFPGRFNSWDGNHQNWLYNSNYTCELSMVLTGAAFFHKYYAYLYSYVMPQAIRDKVDEYLNCGDLAMNFLVSHITRKPPIKVTSRWTFRCPGCPNALYVEESHFHELHKCINFFAQVYGYLPLLNTQFRADSILFKTRIPHDKQKCFKFI